MGLIKNLEFCISDRVINYIANSINQPSYNLTSFIPSFSSAKNFHCNLIAPLNFEFLRRIPLSDRSYPQDTGRGGKRIKRTPTPRNSQNLIFQMIPNFPFRKLHRYIDIIREFFATHFPIREKPIN